MDLRLTLLLICLCRVTNSEVLEDGLVPTTTLPSQVTETESPLPPAVTTEVPTIESVSPTNGVPLEDKPADQCGHAGGRTVAAFIQDLGIKLLQTLKATPEQPNIIISPLSISLALSQLSLGAANETEDLLMHHLHRNTLPCYHTSMHEILERLKENDMHIAARIFLREGFTPKQEFIDESVKFYNSEPAILEGLKQINEWVEKETNGKLTDFMTSLPPDMVLMLINAIHFKGEWQARFDPRSTSKGVFYLDDSHMVEVDMMDNGKHPLGLVIDTELQAQVARFPFVNNMSLLAIIPFTGPLNVSVLSANLNFSSLYERMPKERDAHVKVPKFKLEYSQELQEALTKLGLGDVFANPNLANMADGPLLVSGVQHKSSMEINEEGTEAAGTTSVIISRASHPNFYLNKPFMFAIMDDNSQVPIFLGVINNPNPEGKVWVKQEKDKMDASKESHGSPPK
ncbi:serpin peptidase inhibitor, clade F (alpha-2 antiplasmin, pigment epithelium derived factor), member 2b [Synchiropus picturatus]